MLTLNQIRLSAVARFAHAVNYQSSSTPTFTRLVQSLLQTGLIQVDSEAPDKVIVTNKGREELAKIDIRQVLAQNEDIANLGFSDDLKLRLLSILVLLGGENEYYCPVVTDRNPAYVEAILHLMVCGVNLNKCPLPQLDGSMSSFDGSLAPDLQKDAVIGRLTCACGKVKKREVVVVLRDYNYARLHGEDAVLCNTGTLMAYITRDDSSAWSLEHLSQA